MRIVYNKLYKYEFALFKGEPLEKAFKWTDSSLKIENYRSSDACVFRNPSQKAHVIWFKSKKPGVNQVAHEAFHSVFHVMHHLEAPLVSETEECWAYLLDWTVTEILKK